MKPGAIKSYFWLLCFIIQELHQISLLSRSASSDSSDVKNKKSVVHKTELSFFSNAMLLSDVGIFKTSFIFSAKHIIYNFTACS